MSNELGQVLETLQFDSAGLLPVVVQDSQTGEVLMLAWMNEQAITQTLESRVATYFSRSRNEIWVKGETSGNSQEVISLAYDCDRDALLLKVIQVGVACHTGSKTCFDHQVIETP